MPSDVPIYSAADQCAIMLSDFINLERHDADYDALYPPEIDVILEVIRSVLGRLAPTANCGTFILDGQKTGEEAKCTLRFNFPDGYFHRYASVGGTKSSNQLAEDAIDELLQIPGPSRYLDGDAAVRRDICNRIEEQGRLWTDLWRAGELNVLVINTTYGRFLVSCYAMDSGRPSHGTEIGDRASGAVLYAVALTLGRIGLEDVILQNSVQSIRQLGERVTIYYREVEELVDQLFTQCATPAVQAWQTWHEPANNSGQLLLFFENM